MTTAIHKAFKFNHYSRAFRNCKHRLVDRFVTAVGADASYAAMLKFELDHRFLYTRARALSELGYTPNLKAPKSFNEKSIHRRLFSRDPLWPVVMNKITVRNWVKEHCESGNPELLNLIGTVEDVECVERYRDAGPIAIKAAWASGLNLFIARPESEDWETVKRKMRAWQQAVYFPKRLAWAVTQMKRDFCIEKLIAKKDSPLLTDYKFFVMNGRVELLQVIAERSQEPAYSHFDRMLNPLPSVMRSGCRNQNFELPSGVEKLIPIAERIGSAFDFARVDLYLDDGVVLFGEITQCPANGFARFSPESFDFELGEKWDYDHAGVYQNFVKYEGLEEGRRTG